MADIGASLSTGQKQSLRINPAQLQKIEILQMSAVELEEKIREELMENPVLEVAEREANDETDPNNQNNHDTGTADEALHQDEQPAYDSYDDHDYWELHDSRSHSQAFTSEGGISDFENFYRVEETLFEYLLKQLGVVRCSDTVKKAAGYIIYSLNDNGYLDTELSEIADMAGCTYEEAESALSIVQGLDPAGVGARSVAECLCLQLDPQNDLSEDASHVISEYLREIATGNIKAITASLNITAKRLVQIIDLIRTLEPYPCSHFSDHRPVQFMNPDVYADMVDGTVEVWLAGSLPNLCLSSYYTSLIKTSSDRSVTDYLKERIESATRFIQNIDQRNRTLLNVSKAVMQHQKHFIEYGPKAMQALTMQEIADQLEISVSTVSRAVCGKNIHISGSTYALRQFFSSEVGGATRDSVLERIKELISSEDPAHPLSDQKLAEMLEKEGVEISRRTIAKYRDSAGILPTSMRRTR